MVGLLLAAGCMEPVGQWQRPGRAARPTPRPDQKATAQPDRQDEELLPAEAPNVYLLYLVRGETSVPEVPYIRSVRLANAEPTKAVRLVAWLSEPVGYGGGVDRQFLLYSDPLVWSLGAEVAGMVDVGTAAGNLAEAITTMYSAPGPGLTGPAAARAALRTLEPLCSGQSGQARDRWAANMLAGRLSGECLGRWADAAKRFDQAAQVATVGSAAELIARWSKANALAQAGNGRAAKAVCRRIIQHGAEKFKHAWAFRQAEALAAPAATTTD